MTLEANADATANALGESAPQSAPAAVSVPGSHSWWGIAIVLALTFAVYTPTLRYQFVHDDRGQLVENPAVHSWHAVPTYFTDHVWAAVSDPRVLGNYYRPLFLIWLRVNDVVFGNHAWGWHLTTILVHMLATFLLYLLILRQGIDRDVGVVAALIFGLHPAHIEAVAWISGVTEPLLGVFLIATILAYVQWRGGGPGATKWKAASLLFFALAILEKETAMILPAILLVYEWIFGTLWGTPFELRKTLDWCREAFGKIWPYFVVVAVYVPMRIHALKGFSHVMARLSLEQMVFTWPMLAGFWIRHLLWPAGLSTFYNFHPVLLPNLWNFVLPAIFEICVGLALFACVRRSRTASFFAAWLMLPFIPLLNLRVFVANDFAHDRYLYLPSAGLAVLVAMLLKKVCSGPPQWLGMPTSLLIVVIGLTAGMSYGTVTESFYFKDNLAFYSYNLILAPHNPDAESNYGSVLAESGQFGPAIDAFLDAVTYNPDYYTPTYNLALTYYKVGNMPEAERYFLRAIQINPNKSDEYFYLGLVRFKTGRTADGIACLRQAIILHPNGTVYHFALGMMLKTQGDVAGAIEEFKTELAYNPGQQSAAEQLNEVERRLAAHPQTRKP